MNLHLTEQYTLCLLDQKKQNKILFFSTSHPLIIAMSAFIELNTLNAITFNNKKVIISNELKSNKKYLNLVYNTIKNSKPKSLKKWIEFYIGTISCRRLKELFFTIISDLEITDVLSVEHRIGLLKENIIYNVNNEVINCIINSIRKEFLDNGELTQETAILSSLMLQGDILKDYFSKHEKSELKKRIKEIKKSGIYETISIVQNIIDEINTAIVAASIS